ncbi:MAG: DMT family transporter [Streptococcaceae bacterium]|jgi:transporter family-2 protein|nr:DMT family transporter [Streptococcaceae bacterium]
MIAFLGIALLAGFLLANQSPINTDLRGYAGSPLSAGLISFAVGTVFLAFVTLIVTHSFLPSLAFISHAPWWIWLGGLLGAIYLTSNILLFPRLGALQTVILPIFGQILMGIAIDTNGWFFAPELPLTLMRILGIVLLIIGMLSAVVLPSLTGKKTEKAKQNLLPWQIWGVVIGMMGATQQAINGHLGVALHNTPEASFVSFLVGTVLIFIVVLIVDKRLPSLKNLRQAKVWNFSGGILGALFVFATVVCVPQIGAGLTIMMGLIGQIVGSIIVQQFGLWRSVKLSVNRWQIIGVLIMLVAVGVIKFL